MLFAKPGAENSQKTVEIAIEAARQRGVKRLVVSSSSGASADLLAPYLDEFEIVVIGQVTGFRPDGQNPMSQEKRQELRQKGFEVYHGTHVLSGAERAFSGRFQGVYPVEVMAYTLRMFSQGVKVCVEIATMALDGDLLQAGEDIIALAGTRRGLDTALYLQPAHAQKITETKIHEILCKPRVD
ncbi:MAG: hypothetical protein GX138_08315 [Firmicutes bacterium]|jgi:hypothetical protein|nr:hypothetical protein [Bacillota bacterium]